MSPPDPWFNRLPGFTRSGSGGCGAAGWEWRLWCRLPALLAWGTALPALLGLAWHLMAPAEPTAAEASALMLRDFMLIGVVVLHWTLVLNLAIGCFIVRAAESVMKGPAYVADPYPPADRPTGPAVGTEDAPAAPR